MGKGDKRSKRGKIRLGSYGNTRRRKKAKKFIIHKSPAQVSAPPAPKPKEVVVKKIPAKKPVKKTSKKK